ncbi:metalloenzyme domain protein [Melioribacter roseus P3M-2]|uniref:Metalloenzyme domain protein n=1 Tax=Melioribacter roseus (strain DSM 23840 / JCM 17771 / VKM B-2668 / P3M-2) TaxID=1191523 RepID=I6ZW12_MELRP|nr:metalloenzyme [Melioribacter roseus]AFN73268.1 metalloenzyme domain protein [Melioribacter roseus P3M-2]
MKSVLMIFIDGVGIGKKDYINNPFFKYDFKIFKELFGEIPHLEKRYLEGKNSFVFPIDALMGVPDIPLSGTGQTAIFCGVNAPKIIGKHFGPYPYSTLVPIIKEKNIFIELKRKRKKVAFVNAYPKQFFDYVKKGRRMLSVTTLSCLLSGVKLNKINDLHKGRALSADIDNYRFVHKMNYKLKVISPELAARRLVRIASRNHFTLFEYFHTDHLGHGRNLDLFDRTVNTLDGFLHNLVKILPDEMTLLICSDHGNFEDLTVRTHTLNPALGLAYGKYAERIAPRIKSLYDIKSSIMELYE